MVSADYFYPDWECLVDFFSHLWLKNCCDRQPGLNSQTLYLSSQSGTSSHGDYTIDSLVDYGQINKSNTKKSEVFHAFFHSHNQLNFPSINNSELFLFLIGKDITGFPAVPLRRSPLSHHRHRGSSDPGLVRAMHFLIAIKIIWCSINSINVLSTLW